MKTRVLLVIATVLLAAGPLAAADLGLRGFGVQAGVAAPEDFDTGLAIGLSADLGEVYKRIVLAPSIGYWRASASEDFGGFGADLDVTAYTLGADVHYYLKEARNGIYVGGGVHLNRITYEDAVTLPFVGRFAVLESTVERVGPAAVAGYRGAILGLDGFAEAKFSAVSGFNTLQLTLGAAFGD